MTITGLRRIAARLDAALVAEIHSRDRRDRGGLAEADIFNELASRDYVEVVARREIDEEEEYGEARRYLTWRRGERGKIVRQSPLGEATIYDSEVEARREEAAARRG